MKDALKIIQPTVTSIFGLTSQLQHREYTFREGINPLELSAQEFTLLLAFVCFHSGVKYEEISHLITRRFIYSIDDSTEKSCDAAIDQDRELKNNRSCVNPATNFIRW